MPVADYETYCNMIDKAKANHFAYPAINVASIVAANGVLRGLAESKSDGIIQVSTGGAAFASGSTVKDMVLGAISIAEHVHRAAERYPVYVALHTDHCPPDHLDRFVLPLIEETERRRAAGKPQSLQQPHVRREFHSPGGKPGYLRQAPRTLQPQRSHPRDRGRGCGG